MYANTASSRPTELFAGLDELQRQFDELFSGRQWPSSIRSVGRSGFPAINMGVTPESVEVFAFVPGIDARELAVTLDKGLLTLTGQRKNTLPKEGDPKVNVYARERSTGPFRRVINLPDDVDPERVSASYRDGVLRVSIQKREASKPRRIDVQ